MLADILTIHVTLQTNLVTILNSMVTISARQNLVGIVKIAPSKAIVKYEADIRN